ncbi:hypothetical protein ACFL08_02430 [Patescibacteria group bacterium]
MNIADFSRNFLAGNKVLVQGLCGRIIRGTRPEDFLTLTDDPTRKLVMLMGPDGLEKIIGKSGYESLVEIGYESDYIVRKVADEGNQFKLVVFPEGGEALLATWDNVVKVVSDVYPGAKDALDEYLVEFRNIYGKYANPRAAFANFEALAKFSFSDVDKKGPSDPQFMTYDRFLRSDQSLADTRAFLYFSIHLRELFSGDGYTYNVNGKKGLMEYIVPNKPLDELGDCEVIDLDIQVPQIQKQQKPKGRRSMMNVQMLVIDPQNDFCDPNKGTLYVPGADQDMIRLAALVDRLGSKVKAIHTTLDQHHRIDVAHPTMWMDVDGNPPPHYTIITADDIENGIWTPRRRELKKRFLEYARQLEVQGNYLLCIWPVHCQIGTWGANVVPVLQESYDRWCEQNVCTINYVSKGSNPFTEHYGGLMAEVPDQSDPTTSLNTKFIEVLEKADMIIGAGEASSHCLLATLKQIAENIGEEHLQKFRILQDCCSPVPKVGDGPDFPQIATDFFREMEQKGMHLVNSVDFLV